MTLLDEKYSKDYIEKDPIPLIYPNPVVLVTTSDVAKSNKTNIITLTLVGALCWKPPIIGIGVGKNQYSGKLIEECREFAINIPTTDMINDVEYCGLVSGKEVDKTLKTNFTLVSAKKIRAKIIQECPVNLECFLKTCIPLGSNVLYLGEVIYLSVHNSVLDEKGGINLAKASPILFNLTNSYWNVGIKIANYGFSLK